MLRLEDIFLLKQILSVYDSLDEEGEENEPEALCERIPPKIEYRLPTWVDKINEREESREEPGFLEQVDTSIRQLMTEIYTALNHRRLTWHVRDYELFWIACLWTKWAIT